MAASLPPLPPPFLGTHTEREQGREGESCFTAGLHVDVLTEGGGRGLWLLVGEKGWGEGGGGVGGDGGEPERRSRRGAPWARVVGPPPSRGDAGRGVPPTPTTVITATKSRCKRDAVSARPRGDRNKRTSGCPRPGLKPPPALAPPVSPGLPESPAAAAADLRRDRQGPAAIEIPRLEARRGVSCGR